MHKPTIGELVTSGLRAGFSRNAVIATVLSLLTLVLVPLLFFALGLIKIPPQGHFSKPDLSGQVMTLMLLVSLTVLAATLLFQPFAIGMVEHVFRRPSPNGTSTIFIRQIWTGFVITLLILPFYLIASAISMALGPILTLLLSPLLFVVMAYVQLGFALVWPFAVYEEHFSVFDAYRAMRGNRLLMLATQFILTLPSVLIIMLLGQIGHFAIREQALWLLPVAVLTMLILPGLFACSGLGAATRLYLWHRDHVVQAPSRRAAHDASGLS